jgi:hypothetical protein
MRFLQKSSKSQLGINPKHEVENRGLTPMNSDFVSESANRSKILGSPISDLPQ